jgi:hypothetical protein
MNSIKPVPQETSQERRARRTENFLIIVCILPLWSIVFRVDHILFTCLHLICIAVLGAILVRRIRRIRRFTKDSVTDIQPPE